MDIERLISESESYIRSGRTGAASQLLKKINASAVAREVRLPLANLCRRAGLISLGIKLLSAVVRPKQELEIAATNSELAEYGVLLHRFGALSESLAVLNSVDTNQAPEALL